MVFYDAGCGVCHRAVRFLLARDRAGHLFRFAPLGGETFRARLPQAARAAAPDSLAVLTPSGRLLFRSQATAHLLRRLGGAWRAPGALLAWLPRPLADAAYDCFARLRRHLAARPAATCPALSPGLRARFHG